MSQMSEAVAAIAASLLGKLDRLLPKDTKQQDQASKEIER